MRCLFNDQWSFVKTDPDSGYAYAAAQEKETVFLPHDWAIGEAEQFYCDADGWYFKTIDAGSIDQDHPEVFLYFDGVYTDAQVWLNGEPISEHHYGYTAFYVTLGGLLQPGRNVLAVRVRYRCPNSRWYSGAGIFRDVELLAYCSSYLVPDGWQIDTKREGDAWRLVVSAETVRAEGLEVRAVLYDGKAPVWQGVAVSDDKGCLFETELSGIIPWSLNRTKLYRLELSLLDQTETLNIGFRETEFTTDRGFFLNGEAVRLHGVCLHHDLGALGAAFHMDAARRQLKLMKDMGVNAIRTSHNPPARKFLDLCDEMGLLVDDELYDMWELPKTQFDHARFFPEVWREDVASWIRRDRCHPSVFMWSIGNEIQDMFLGERGYQWACRLTDEARRHDRFGHGRVTFGSNYMPWEGAQHCAEYVKLAGYNYAEAHYEAHHRAHPDWIIYGSETSSMVQSRGIYHFPMSEDILSEEDLQCSTLLNSKTSWGTQSLQRMLAEDRICRFSLGQFIWAGIDYIGEPTPYHTKNSYFGQADTACFPKDTYYFYQAMWSGKPMAHIGVSWKWNHGQPVDVPVMSNCPAVELILNGVSLGRRTIDLNNADRCLPVWTVPYTDGVLEAYGYDAEGKVRAKDVRCSYGSPAALKLEAESMEIQPGGLAFITVTAEDGDGHPVEDAVDKVHINVSGNGRLVGLDNGDSTDMTSYQSDCKRLFSGKLLAIVRVDSPGMIAIRAESSGIRGAVLCLNAAAGEEHINLAGQAVKHTKVYNDPDLAETTWVRRIDLKPAAACELNPDCPTVDFAVRREPENAKHEIILRVTNAQGVDYPGASVTWTANGTARVEAFADGRFFLRATTDNGDDHTRVISVYPIHSCGFGAVTLDPYNLVSGSLSDVRIGEISPGNEQGIAFAREGFSGAGFRNIDFGPAGSDVIELPIFAVDDNEHDITLWDGNPEKGGRQIMICRYQVKSIWNTYQSQSFKLPEILRGKHDLYLTAYNKVHLKGIMFRKQSRAFRINTGRDADEIYGDTYCLSEDAVLDIGNNVTLIYHNMEFPRSGPFALHVYGRTAHDETPVMLRFRNMEGEDKNVRLDFRREDEASDHVFQVSVPEGMCDLNWVFLPGCHFDLYSFRFEEG